MSWRDIELVWSDTEHEWNELGTILSPLELGDDEFYATNVYIWRGVELGNIVDNVVSSIQSATELLDEPKLATGFVLAVTALNLFPIYIKKIEDDEHAAQFLALIQKEQGQHFLIESQLSDTPEIEYLIEQFIQLKMLKRSENRLVIQGKVLNRVHLQM